MHVTQAMKRKVAMKGGPEAALRSCLCRRRQRHKDAKDAQEVSKRLTQEAIRWRKIEKSSQVTAPQERPDRKAPDNDAECFIGVR
jgi:hypothetical protein